MRVVYTNPDSHYSVLRLRDDDDKELTLVGLIPNVMEGQRIEATGRWERHKEHGRQFHVNSFNAILPSSEEGIRRYLASGVLPGIGEKYAERIVEHFGADTLDVLDKASERLKEVPGIGKKRIAEIRQAWRDSNSLRSTLVFLQGLGLSPSLCGRIVSLYGDKIAAEVVQRNPYRLAYELDGVGFLTADRIAMRLGIAATTAPCDSAPGWFSPWTNSANRDTPAAARKRSSPPPNACSTPTPPTSNRASPPPCRKTKSSWTSSAAPSPRRCSSPAGSTPPRSTSPRHPRAAQQPRAWPAAAPRAPRPGLRAAQPGPAPGRRVRLQLRLQHHHRRPGVGKTTVVSQIVAGAAILRKRILLAAPTGRASKRLSEATDCEASTIHRLLKWDPQERAFVHGRTSLSAATSWSSTRRPCLTPYWPAISFRRSPPARTSFSWATRTSCHRSVPARCCTI
jgi:exodeoxyribonuclease V alpha subunit